MAEEMAANVDEAWAIIPCEPFGLELDGVGEFGGAKPHAIWAGVKLTEPLKQLQARHESAMRRVGLAPEQRKYLPHVTLARLRAIDTPEVYRFIAAHNLFATPQSAVHRAVLDRKKGVVGKR